MDNINFDSISFAASWVFYLLPLPLILHFLLPAAPIKSNAALRIPFFNNLQTNLQVDKKNNPFLRFLIALLAIAAWLFLIIATAQPQFVGETVRQSISGRSLLMAVDISRSMQARDMVIGNRAVTRLLAVKAVASEFITKREGDRIGLILFGSQAYLQAPLTFDRKTVNILLDEAELGLAGSNTAMGDAIGLAVKRLRKEPEKNRVLILLTDGANTAGNVDPLKAADLAAQEKIIIYTIGVGADEQYVQTPFGQQRVRSSDLDEETLKAIAEKTNGRYFRARNVQGLLKIYSILDKIEPVSKDELSYRPVSELYYYPLAIALLLSFMIALLTRISSLPRTTSKNEKLI